MITKQYTIRAVPSDVDQYLRRQARAQGKSLNRVVLDHLSQATKLEAQSQDDDSFDWLIGANLMDEDTLQAIDDLRKMDKQKSRL